MPSRLHITARPVVLLGEYARSHGLDFTPYARRAGLTPEHLDKPDAEVPCAAFATLLELLAVETNDPQYVLGYVEAMPARPTGVYQMIAYHSDTLRDAFRAMARFSALVTNAFSITFSESGNAGSLTFTFANEQVAQRQFVAGQLGIIAVRARQLIGAHCRPNSVEFTFSPPPATDKFLATFGVPPRFDQEFDRISYSADLLHRPLVAAHKSQLRKIDDYRHGGAAIGGTDNHATVKVAQFIAGALQRGEASELETCRSFKIGRRTLQRELAIAGTTFRQLLQDERARLARHYLVETDLSLTSISLLLGYSELSAFSRASKTWFGISPSIFRQSSRSGGLKLPPSGI